MNKNENQSYNTMSVVFPLPPPPHPIWTEKIEQEEEEDKGSWETSVRHLRRRLMISGTAVYAWHLSRGQQSVSLSLNLEWQIEQAIT